MNTPFQYSPFAPINFFTGSNNGDSIKVDVTSSISTKGASAIATAAQRWQERNTRKLTELGLTSDDQRAGPS
jgi:hypothetical protein